ncbi:SDR family NAD(P)-dependent oxidoreductase [Arthrobacter sp. NPDC058192]|uniref:SDR family NAD(P)-dependent oxidoreductase n=1 Tax=Arthrobacter sp. NPDC058192 TaxID=3346372 RepID=UPI0036EEB1D7
MRPPPVPSPSTGRPSPSSPGARTASTHSWPRSRRPAADDELRGVADIVNISSIAGRQAWVNFAAYNMTKFGVNGFTEALRQKITKKHVRVGVLEPGAVETELISHNNDTVKGDLAVSDAENIPEKLQPEDSREHRVHGDPPPTILHRRAVGHAHVPSLRTLPKENTA